MRMSFIIISLLMLNCISGMSQEIKNYTLELDIQTSFQGSKKWIIQRDQAYCIFDNLRYNFNEKDSLLVHYFQQLDTILNKYKFYKLSSYSYKNGVQTGEWIDGTMTYGKLTLPDTIKSFNFHSGNIDYDKTQIELIDNFFNIAFYLYNQNNFGEKLKISDSEYLEKIENEVGRTPIRQVSVYPLHYKLFDRVYSFNFAATKQLFETLPKDKPILIEVGKYVNIRDEFEVFLKEYFKTRKNIYWIIGDKNQNKMVSLGLENKYLLENIKDFRRAE